MMAADYLLVPLEADVYGAKSIGHVMKRLAEVRARGNPALTVLGPLRNKFQQRVAVQASFAEMLRSDWPELLLDGAIPLAAQFRDADLAGKPIGFFKPRCAAAKAVATVAAELEARIEARAQRAAA
jgi:chromosome partitioning protein